MSLASFLFLPPPSLPPLLPFSSTSFLPLFLSLPITLSPCLSLSLYLCLSVSVFPRPPPHTHTHVLWVLLGIEVKIPLLCYLCLLQIIYSGNLPESKLRPQSLSLRWTNVFPYILHPGHPSHCHLSLNVVYHATRRNRQQTVC